MATNTPLHVIIAGGGIGGLALANGLRRAGVSVSVHERETQRTDRLQGFRIHINPHGSNALAELLAPEMYSTFVACAGKGGNGFGFVTEQLRELLQIDPEEGEHTAGGHFGISRITLRRLLLADLGDIVRYGSMFDRYERLPDGRIRAYFADGASEIGDVLVGADGGSSRVRAQHLPHAERVDTGIVTIAGKYGLTPRSRARLDARLLRNPLSVIPPSGCGMFLAPHEFDIPAGAEQIVENSPGRPAGLLLDNTQPYVFWAFAAKRERYGAELEALPAADLHELAVRMTAGWAPELRTLVADSDPETATLLPIKTSVPLPAWETTNVTLLGDAIHSMTPFAGIGANTALRDAQGLCRALVAADRREHGLLEGIRSYEADMIDYGFAAVRTSLAAADQSVSDNRFARSAGRLFFRTANAIPTMKRKMFADLGAA
ncbi:FAD-dependent oxidoreductase [Nocardia aurantiaca]|uniref:FAD-dependent monooxygenase n=1 Tax=Nocardia aurantiaca TaxID=2675850 RepID=A0A6I3L1H6_9NOCA|nr:FAD-dependent monooxygenase [Nocardia aurantiaca]MTE13699.1 FAD-dependent monooxygenase [Nocardia aurantiaca]